MTKRPPTKVSSIKTYPTVHASSNKSSLSQASLLDVSFALVDVFFTGIFGTWDFLLLGIDVLVARDLLCLGTFVSMDILWYGTFVTE